MNICPLRGRLLFGSGIRKFLLTTCSYDCLPLLGHTSVVSLLSISKYGFICIKL